MFLSLASLLSTVLSRTSLIYPQLTCGFVFKVFRMYVTYHVPEYIHFVGFLACHPVFPMRNITTAIKCNYEDENVIKTFKFL